MKFKISMIASVFFPKLGGTPTQNHEIAKHLTEKGLNVEVLVTMADRDYNYNNFPYKIVPLHFSGKISEKRYSEYKESLTTFPKLVLGVLKKTRHADIVQCDGATLSGLLACASKVLFRKRIIMNIGGNIYNEARRKSFIKKVISLGVAYMTFRLSDVIITAGDDLKEELTKHGINPGKMITIFNGIDTDFFSSKKVSPEFVKKMKERGVSLDKKKKRIAFAGIMCFETGPNYFVDVIKGLEGFLGKGNVEGIMAGSGPWFDKISEYIKTTGAPVKTIGFLQRSDIANLHNFADISIFPLTSIGGLSQVVPEAMSCGKCIITTNTGSMKDLVKNNRNGFIVEVGDTKSMIDIAVTVLKDNKKRAEIGKNARKFISEKWNWEIATKKYMKLYKQLLGNSSRGKEE